jgi:predicted nucleic acid-binding protein
MRGVTLDTSALIALEEVSRSRSTNDVALRLAKALRMRPAGTGAPIIATTPAVVYAEWWRGQRGPAANLLAANGIEVEPVDRDMAHRVGDLLATAKKRRAAAEGLLLVDAFVVVTAASRGDVVYTSDVDDLQYLSDLAELELRVLKI